MNLNKLFLNSIKCNDLNMARVLIAKGADVREWRYETLMRALKNGHLELVEYLKSVYKDNNIEIPRGVF